jgi:flagellar basal body rod protein FlgG
MISAMRFHIRDLLWLMAVVGLGIALWLERSASPVRFTGQPFDVAIAGDGFFLLTDPATSGCLFTRLGRLSIDSESRLVLDVNEIEFLINPSIQIRSEAVSVSISPTGRVAAQLPNRSDLVAVGQLQLAKFDQPNKLRQVSPAIYTDTTESGFCLQCDPGRGCWDDHSRRTCQKLLNRWSFGSAHR